MYSRRHVGARPRNGAVLLSKRPGRWSLVPLAWLVACLLRGQQPAPPRRATHRAPVDCAAKSRLLEQVIMISSRLKDLVKNVAAPLRERAVNSMRLSCQSSLPGSSSGRRQRLTNHELCRAEKEAL